jgi:GMP synthase (glutamine-hydrolysing)
MNIHYLQHVPFEGPGSIEDWARRRGHSLSAIRLFQQAEFPKPADVGGLVVMGGPMSVDEEGRFAWLTAEKKFLASCIDLAKPILGICLGSQLLAEVLGAAVYPNRHREIGWFPIELTPDACQSPFFENCPRQLQVFHWHGDTYDLPLGSTLLATSEACHNQAFVHGRTVLGLQFHLEVSPQSISSLVENCASDLTGGKYVQRKSRLSGKAADIETANGVMTRVLDTLFGR